MRLKYFLKLFGCRFQTSEKLTFKEYGFTTVISGPTEDIIKVCFALRMNGYKSKFPVILSSGKLYSLSFSEVPTRGVTYRIEEIKKG